MFSNFKKAFMNKTQSTDAPPQVIIDAINADLPEGFFYVHDHDGFCRLDAKEGLQIQCGKIILSEKAKGVLSEQPTIDELRRYAYNSQTPIKVGADEEGCILINGKKIKINEMVKAPLKDIKIETSELWMQPRKFPDPFILKVGGDNYECEVLISRKPYNSVYTQLYESINNSLISIKYLLNTNNDQAPTFTFTISIDIENAKKVSDVVAAYHIFNAFMDGCGTIGGMPLSSGQKHSNKKVSEDTIMFWDKLMALENCLNREFDIKNGITIGDARIIEELYRSLIEKKPFKTYRTYNSVTGKSGSESIPEIESEQEIYLEFESVAHIELLGNKIEVRELKGIFGAALIKPEEKDITADGEYEIRLITVPGKKMYDSAQYYLNEEDLNNTRKNHSHIELFRVAEEIHSIE